MLKNLVALILFTLYFQVSGQGYNSVYFTEEDGLPSSTVYDIEQDDSGRMFFTSRRGIVIYDGYTWEKQYPDEFVKEFYKLFKDEQGIIWALPHHSSGSIVYYDGDTWKNLELKFDEKEDLWNYSFAVHNNNGDFNLLLISEKGDISFYRNNNWESFTSELFNNVYCVDAFNGMYYLGTDKGVILVSQSGEISTSSLPNLPKQKVIDIQIDHFDNGKLWISGYEDIGYIKNNEYISVKNVKNYFPADGVKRRRQCFLHDYFGYSLYADEYTQYQIGDNDLKEVNPSFGFPFRGALSYFVDKENNFWVSGYRGVAKFEGFQILSLNKNNGLPYDEVTAITADKNKIYIGHLGGVSTVNKNSKTFNLKSVYNETTRLKGRAADFELFNNDVMVALEMVGFGKIHNSGISFLDVKADKLTRCSSILGVDNSLYFLTSKKLYKKVGNDVKLVAGIDKIGLGRKLFHGGGDTLIVVTSDRGIVYLKDDEVVKRVKTGNHKVDNLYAYLSANGEEFVGSLLGVYKVKNDSLVKVSFNGASIDNPTFFVNKSKLGELWFGTDNGVYRWNGENLNNYGLLDGIIGLETNRDAFWENDNGDIWVGTSQGLSIIKTRYDNIVKPKPEVIFDYIIDGSDTLKFTDSTQIIVSDKNIEVSLKLVSMVNKDDIKAKVRIGNKEWISIDKNRLTNIRFSNLNNEFYNIEVMPIVNGVPLDIIKSPQFKVSGSFISTYEFRVITFISLVMVLLLVIKYHKKTLYTGKLEREVSSKANEIRASELRNRYIYRLNKHPMILIESKNYSIIEINKAALELYGINENEFLGKNLTEIEPGLNLGFLEDMLNDKQFDELVEYETVHLTNSGKKIDVEVNYSKLPVNNNSVIFLLVSDISDKKQAVRKLKESEEKYKALVNCINDGIILISEDKIVFVNPYVLEYLNVTPEEILGESYYTFIEEDKWASASDIYDRVLYKNEKISNYEARLITKSGRRLYANMSFDTVVYQNKKVVMATLLDVTDAKERNEEIKILSTIVEQSPVNIIMTSLDNKIQYVNPMFCNTSGFNRGEVLGKHISFVRDDKTNAGVYSAILKDLHMQGKWYGELKNKKKNKDNYWVSSAVSTISDDNNNAQNYIYLEIDITFEKHALEEIKRNEKLLNSILNNLPVTLIVVDNDGMLRITKNITDNSFGYEENPEKLIHYTDVYGEYPPIVADIEEALSGFKFTSIRNMEDKHIETHYSDFTDSKGNRKGIIGVTFDVTERENSRKELVLAKEAAEKSDNLKSEFLAQVSHEIRTPINAIISFSSLIKEEVGDKVTDDLKYGFQVIDNGGRRLIRTIDLILNMSQIQTNTYDAKFEELSLHNDVFLIMIAEMKRIAKNKNLELIYEPLAVDKKIIGDEYTVYQIFNNLVDNAIKYTDKGSVSVKIKREANFICVSVEDTGIGMSKEFQKDIFSAFSQEDTGYTRKYEGNGLGMALVKEYCNLNNAEISVESEKGKGTIVTVRFAI